MNGFFKTKRRKFGLLTLSFALLLTGAWIRSQKYIESGTFRLSKDRILAGCSNRGSFRLITFQYVGETPDNAAFPVGTVKWERATVISSDPVFMNKPAEIFFPILINADLEWHAHRQMLDFDFAKTTLDESSVKIECLAWKIPHVPIILLMTVISGLLLLVSPRSGNVKVEE